MKQVFLFLISCSTFSALQAQVKHVAVKPSAAKQSASKPASTITTSTRQAPVRKSQAPVAQAPVAQTTAAPVQQAPVRQAVVRQEASHTPVQHAPSVRSKASGNLPPMTFGVKGGMNISKVGGADADGFRSKIGFHAGGFVNIPVAQNFSIQPELMFSMQGAKVRGYDDFGGSGDIKYNLSYINLPVVARYTTDFGLYAETGPQVGFLIGAKEKYGSSKNNISDQLKKVDFAWTFGAGYITDANIGFSARYDLGISKIGANSTARRHNNVFQVGVFYVLGGNR